MNQSFIILDPQVLKTYTQNCMQTGSNICVLENGENSETLTADYRYYDNDNASVNASAATSSKKKFSFLCGSFEGETYIYAIKISTGPWHYFHELDTHSSLHDALPASRLDVVTASCLARPNKLHPFDINLTENQLASYFRNDQFIFKNEQLKTRKSFRFNSFNDFQPDDYYNLFIIRFGTNESMQFKSSVQVAEKSH